MGLCSLGCLDFCWLVAWCVCTCFGWGGFTWGFGVCLIWRCGFGGWVVGCWV